MKNKLYQVQDQWLQGGALPAYIKQSDFIDYIEAQLGNIETQLRNDHCFDYALTSFSELIAFLNALVEVCPMLLNPLNRRFGIFRRIADWLAQKQPNCSGYRMGFVNRSLAITWSFDKTQYDYEKDYDLEHRLETSV